VNQQEIRDNLQRGMRIRELEAPLPKGEERRYTIFFRAFPPQSLLSEIDYRKLWVQQIELRTLTGEWWRPIDFYDETGAVVASYLAEVIVGVVQGGIAPQKKAE
jgi:P pilus assembly chaperone PapD